MKHRLLALVLALVLVLPLLPLTGVFSFADNGIMYYDENGNLQYYTGPVAEITPSTWGVEGQTTWYYVNDTFNPYNRLSFRGDVHLILGNNALITFDNLQSVPHPVETASYNGRKLTIYAQSQDKNECGKMILNCMGSEGYRGLGSITINGGNIESVAVKSYTFVERGVEGAADAAGLGMYYTYEAEPRYAGGSITINGGFVKAVGSNFAAGIGGSFGSSVKTITINGGEVEARGGYGAPGIGTGYACGTKNEECEININGGTVTAIGGTGAPGIGSGFNAHNNLTINITGGKVNATYGTQDNSVVLTQKQTEKYKITEESGGAAIGAAAFTQGDVTVNISGGEVTATGGQGAGIGGSNKNVGNVNVAISGGTVNATSSRGAGIGSGYYQSWGSQNNGKVTNVTITGGEVTASSTNGAGIGAGEINKATVNVNICDGKVSATTANPGARGIGDGLSNNPSKTSVTLSWSRVDSSIYANSYNSTTVINGFFRAVDNVNPRVVQSIDEAENTTIRPFLYDWEFGSEQGLYLEMTGCEKKYLDEYLALSIFPFLEDRVIYVVERDMTIPTLFVTGTSVLFLRENATLTVTDGVYVVNDDAFTIGYQNGNLVVVAEKEDSGKLVVGPAVNGAAIGTYVDEGTGRVYDTGLIRVYSGTVEARGAAGYPAIGGQNLSYSQYGGVVKAYGGQGAPGIGSFPNGTGASIELKGGRLTARGGTTAQPVGLGGANATITVSWDLETDAFDLDPCVGSVTIENGKEFKYLHSSPVQAATAADFLTGGVFVPHASTYYIDKNGDRVTLDDYIELSNNGNANTNLNGVDGGWYVCVNDARNPLQIGEITVNGTMNLVLTDGTEMRPNSIIVNPGATLNIYCQSDGTGVLRTRNFGDGISGIGGGTFNTSVGTINIYGGRIIAQGTKYASAIGGAGLNGGGGTINIYGGDVTATPGTEGSSGIGDGWNQSGFVINFYGGRINAGSVSGALNFYNYFFYEDDGTRAFPDEYDAARTIVPGIPEAAEYIDESGEQQSTVDYKHLRENETTLSGVYYIYEDTTMPERPTVSGSATLILKDGVTLTAAKGIGVNEGSSLTVYANSRNENQTGALVVSSADSMHAGIGGDGYLATGTQDNNYETALGSGDILIAGGKITAVGGAGAAAIGAGGSHYHAPKDGGSITITDGFVTATGNSGPAIGAGSNVKSVNITITGGKITATGGSYGAGIGAIAANSISDTSVYSFVIYISGGEITAKGGGQGMTNIGTTYANTTITIEGGHIDASYTAGTVPYGIGHTNTTSVSVVDSDPDLWIKYSMIRAAEVNFYGSFAYTDGTTVCIPVENNKTIVNLDTNFGRVYFNAANGTPVSSILVRLGEKATAPQDPAASTEGYHFVGWYDEANGNTLFDFDEDVITDSLTLTAHYEKNVYTVTFEPDNGDEAFTQQVEHGDALADPGSNFEKPHATFDYWMDESGPYAFGTPVTGPFTLTAHWAYENITVTFNTLDGSTATQIVPYGGKAATPGIPERAGFTFLGWRVPNAVGYFDFEQAITEELTLCAVWTYTPCTAIDGTSGANSNESYGKLLDGSTASKWCVTSFTGCYIEFSTDDYIVPTGYVLTTAGDTASNPGRNPNGWTIYGRNSTSDDWTAITSVSGVGTLDGVNCTPFIFDMANSDAYRFFKVEFTSIKGGNYGVFQLSEFAFIVDSVRPVPTYTVTYDLGSGSGEIENDLVRKGDVITLPGTTDVTAPEGTFFTGWSDGNADYEPGGSYTVNDSVVISAIYTEAVTVTFKSSENDPDGETFTFPIQTEVDMPGGIFFPAPEGKAFDYWIIQDGSGEPYYEGDPFIIDSSVVFVAVWRDASAWEILQAQLEALEDGESLSIVLTEDVIAPNDTVSCLYIYEGTEVTIDLAGYKIDRALTDSVDEGMVFMVDGTLTINDSSAAKTGLITGGNNVENYGEGGGVYVSGDGVFYFNGGTISGNSAYYGGGVESYGQFIMTGGVITGNQAIYNGGGVEIYSNGEITVSGSAQIYGNFVCIDEGDPIENNVGLYEDSTQFITIGGAFTSDARIGVSTQAYIDEDQSFSFTYGLNGASASAFFSDGNLYRIGFDEYGEAMLMIGAGIYGDINNDGDVTVADVSALLDYIAGKAEDDYDAVCDLNSDGTISVSDVSALLDYLAGN